MLRNLSHRRRRRRGRRRRCSRQCPSVQPASQGTQRCSFDLFVWLVKCLRLKRIEKTAGIRTAPKWPFNQKQSPLRTSGGGQWLLLVVAGRLWPPSAENNQLQPVNQRQSTHFFSLIGRRIFPPPKSGRRLLAMIHLDTADGPDVAPTNQASHGRLHDQKEHPHTQTQVDVAARQRQTSKCVQLVRLPP